METVQPQSCVGYYRVSTRKQEISGLGLEAQQQAVRDHLDRTNRKLIAELIEVESGKNADRPKLAEALRLCRLTGSKLIVARLDRLARNVAFVSRLMESGADFEAVDFPQANRFTIHILAAVAEYEAKLISERTRAGLAAARARGVKLGGRNPSSGNMAGLAKAREATRAKFAARIADLAPVIEEIRAAGFVTSVAVAHQLNARRIRAACGGQWTPSPAHRVLQRLSLSLSAAESRQVHRAAKEAWLTTLVPVLADIRRAGHKSVAAITRELNAKGVPTRRGGRWTPSLVQRALPCFPESERQSIYVPRKDLARRLRPVIEEIQATGKTFACSIASELNARGIPGLNGGRWRSPSVICLLKRISMVATSRRRADWLPNLAPIIADIRAAGYLSGPAMARELNARGVRTFFGGRWGRRNVEYVLGRMRICKINYDPQEDIAFAGEVDDAKAKNTRRPKRCRLGARSDIASANAVTFRLTGRPSKRHFRGVRKSSRRCKRRAVRS